ncbi:M28 family metallopeptidase [Yunchengibacter salinarum]|uniref:M28 family metallopeptidase n=1 Tax=Yunchengibacter salinarum TaxID=3133399 RepID=UPI0035B653D0
MKHALTLAALTGLLTACDGNQTGDSDSSHKTEKAGQQAETDFKPAISADDLDRHTRTLASDAFGGRPPSGPAAEKTVQYLTDQFQRLGLSPTFGDSYTQTVPLVSITAAGDATLDVTGADTPLSYQYGNEMMVWTTRVVEQAAIEDSELVFVGYGIDAPEYGWNDYAGLDMTGKTAVILVNDPGFATQDPNVFNGNAMTYYGRWTYKYEEAARQGADGAIIIHETAPASYGWSVVENSWSGPQFDLVREDKNMSRVAIEGWVQKFVAEEMFEKAGLDYEGLKKAASKPGFIPVNMGLKASVGVNNTLERSQTVNVAATLEGAERPQEQVIYTAHWDHLGTGPAVDGDTIYNGARDNASGVAGVLEIAERMATRDSRSARSVTFLLVGAEEQGLLGAYHYAANPAFPLAKTAALLNTDVLLPLGETKDVTVIGRGSSNLEDTLQEAVNAQGRTISPYPNPEQGFYFRSDHFAFAKKGVPALYLDTGTEHAEKGAEYMTEQKAHYVSDLYHTPFDEWQPGWDWTGAVMDLEAMEQVGWRVANSADWPEWRAGNPFKAARQQSAAQRQ